MPGTIEARITIPSAGWSFSLTDGSGGPYTIDLTAGDFFYHSSDGSNSNTLAEELKALMDAASGQTYTVTYNTDGTYTISVDSGNYSISWSDTALRNLLGFDANISSQTTSTGADQAEATWFPRCPVEALYGLESTGLPVSAADLRISAGGNYTAFHGPAYRRNELVWLAVSVDRTIQASETIGNTSFETFWLDAIRGQANWATSGRALRWYPDATSATYQEYNVHSATSPEVTRLDERYDGLWTVRLAVGTVGI